MASLPRSVKFYLKPDEVVVGAEYTTNKVTRFRAPWKTGEPISLAPLTLWGTSRDGTRLLASNAAGLGILQVAEQKFTPLRCLQGDEGWRPLNRLGARHLALETADGLAIVDLKADKLIRVQQQTPTILQLSPDESVLAAATREAILLYSTRDGGQLAELRGVGRPTALAFSPDGRYLAAGVNHELRIWELAQPWRQQR